MDIEAFIGIPIYKRGEILGNAEFHQSENRKRPFLRSAKSSTSKTPPTANPTPYQVTQYLYPNSFKLHHSVSAAFIFEAKSRRALPKAEYLSCDAYSDLLGTPLNFSCIGNFDQ